ncbi:MAG: hypothetical protein AAGG57_05960 [Pseudomonadota bacterium]
MSPQPWEHCYRRRRGSIILKRIAAIAILAIGISAPAHAAMVSYDYVFNTDFSDVVDKPSAGATRRVDITNTHIDAFDPSLGTITGFDIEVPSGLPCATLAMAVAFTADGAVRRLLSKCSQ